MIRDYEKEYNKSIERWLNKIEKYDPTRVSSKYISCRNCGSKLNREYISKNYKTPLSKPSRLHCPVCDSEVGLYSTTANKAINSAEEYKNKKGEEYIKYETRKENDKDVDNKSFKKALAETRDRFDFVYDERKTPDFIEIVGSIGGDTCTLRVYNDGSVYSK